MAFGAVRCGTKAGKIGVAPFFGSLAKGRLAGLEAAGAAPVWVQVSELTQMAVGP